jgi:hypothetical protein
MNGAGLMRIPLWKDGIVRMKAKALRRGVWYKVLTRMERMCIDLMLRVVERVRSWRLKKLLASVVEKLEYAMESPVKRLMREVGNNIAIGLSQIAQQWGNKSAWRWVEDASFVQYLAVTYMNASP